MKTRLVVALIIGAGLLSNVSAADIWFQGPTRISGSEGTPVILRSGSEGRRNTSLAPLYSVNFSKTQEALVTYRWAYGVGQIAHGVFYYLLGQKEAN